MFWRTNIGVALLLVTVQQAVADEDIMQGFMTEERAVEAFGSYISDKKSEISEQGFDLDRYDLLVRDDGDVLLFAFVYKEKPRGFRGSDPDYPDTNYVIDRRSGKVVQKYFSR